MIKDFYFFCFWIGILLNNFFTCCYLLIWSSLVFVWVFFGYLSIFCFCFCFVLGVVVGLLWDVELGYLLLHWGLSVLGRRVRTGPIATHFDPACAQTIPFFLLKLLSHAHGMHNCYTKVMAGRYNGAIIKATHLLLDKTKWLQENCSR